MSLKYKSNYKKIIIATHVYATGPSHSLENFLKDKTEKLLFVGHPFVYAKDTKSYYHFFVNGKLVKDTILFKFTSNQFMSQLKDTLLNIFLTIKYARFDLFIGVDSSNAAIGVLLKKFGFTRKVIYYTIDYVPNRFSNKLINSFYHWLDNFSVKYSDYVWNLSSIMVEQREKKGMSSKYRTKQLVVPIGTEFVNIPKGMKTRKNCVAHMGHLLKKQGVQLMLDAIPLIIKKIPDFHLEIIGGGEYENELKLQAKKLKIENNISFRGFIKSHDEVEKRLAECELGIAPYTDELDNYVRFTDPGKVKAYLAAGLPVIITKVPDVYRYLESNQCGIAINYNKQELADAIISLLLDRKKLLKYQRNAHKAAKEFTWDKIFSKALAQSL